ncbi:MAG: hypothetical protein IT385_30935 [Deltaproteobacteria bacterium]|nr:hypothetical protein [Deltaproteobacteria bacterium]
MRVASDAVTVAYHAAGSASSEGDRCRAGAPARPVHGQSRDGTHVTAGVPISERVHMARGSGSLTQISMDKDIVSVTMGRTQLSVPSDQLGALIGLLEAARLMAGSAGASGAAAPEPEPEPAPAPAPTRGRRAAAAAAAEVVAPVAKRRGRPPKNPALGAQRRSRKRVGDALAQWLRDNPGWHSTDELISVVRDNKMTDASPVRAVMIALGKSKGGMFENDGANHWRLKGDEAGPPPAAPTRARKKPGRKPGTGKKKAAAGGGRGKRASSGRRARRSAKADSEGSAPEPATVIIEVTPEVEEPGTLEAVKPVRVKRGQNRKEALMSPAELEARRQAASSVDRMRDRWGMTPRALKEKMRKSLFG